MKYKSKSIAFSFSITVLLLLSLNSYACDGGDGEGGNDNDCPSITPASSQQSGKPDSSAGNPISVITGNKYQREVDYETSSEVASLLLKRHYNSLNTTTDTGLGLGWRHSYDVSLAVDNKKNMIQINQSDGRRILFKLDGVNGKQYRAESPEDGKISALGNQILWSLNDGRSIVFNGARPVKITYPGNRSFILEYQQTSDGHLSKVTDHQGKSLIFNYSVGNTALGSFNQNVQTDANLSGHLQSVTLPDGGVISYSYDSDHNLSKVTYPDKTSRIYHYENIGFPNHLTGITDRTGKRFATWGYTDEGRANLSTHADGAEKVVLEYRIPEQMGDIGTTVVTNSLGQTSTYTWRYFDAISQRLLLSSKGPGCSTCPATNKTYTYNNQYQLETITDTKTADITRYRYDKQGRTSKIMKKVGGVSEKLVVRYEYDGNLPRPTVIARPSVNPKGEHITRITYNEDMLPIIITEKGFSPSHEGDVNESIYNAIERKTKLLYSNGNVATIDGPRENVQDLIQLTYDTQNRLQSLTQPGGESLVMLSYDRNDRPTQIRKGQQSPFYITYHINGKVKEVKQRNNSIFYDYDKEGRLTSISTDINGNKNLAMSMSYDAAGRLDTLNDNKGHRIQQLHDTESRLIKSTTSTNTGSTINTISYLYDAQGRLDKTQTRDLDDETETDYQYDNKDQLTKVEKNGQTVTLSYNNLGQLINLTQPGDVVTQFNYDNKGQGKNLSDARDNKTKTIKDDFGRVIQHTSADTGTNIYTYDNAGNRIERTDPDGNITTYQWNAANKLVKKESTDTRGGTEITTYKYDQLTGKLLSTQNSDTTEYFKYNNEGQLISHSRDIDGHNFTTQYEYNEQGSLHKKQLPDGQVLRFHYYTDNTIQQIGRLRAITRESLFGLSQDTIISEIDEDKKNGQTGYLSHNGLLTRQYFRQDGQLASIQIKDTLKLQYSYDQNGEISGIDEDGTLQSYEYNQGRLTFADTITGQYQYSYDKVGNRTRKTVQSKAGYSSTETYQYPEKGKGNRLISHQKDGSTVIGKGTIEELSYNKSGSPKNTKRFSYEYNTSQRPIKVYETTNGQKQLLAEYRYNSFGERIKKVSYSGNQKTVTYYLYDGHSLTAEVDEAGDISAQYIYLKNQPIAKLEKKSVFAIHSDHIGTPRLVTNDNKATVWKADYSPFGKAQVITQKITLNLRLPGQYEDQETKTHYNYLRDYNPETGRYITSDPIGLKGGVNTYAYVDGSPIGNSDVLGLLKNNNSIVVDGVPKPVADEATFLEKTQFVLDKVPSYLASGIQGAIQEFLKPGNIRVMVGLVGAIAALQLVPGLNVVVNVALVGWTWWEFGSAALKLVYQIFESIWDISRARTRTALCATSKKFADSLLTLAASLPPGRFSTLLGSAKSRMTSNANKHGVDPNNPKKLEIKPINDIPSRWSKIDDDTIQFNGGPISRRLPDEKAVKIGDKVYTVWQRDTGGFFIFRNGKQQYVKNPTTSDKFETGLVGEIRTAAAIDKFKRFGVLKRYDRILGEKNNASIDGSIEAYRGRQGIDAIYFDKKLDKYVFVETKATTGTSAGGLNKTDNGTQLSQTWLTDRVNRLFNENKITKQQKDDILKDIDDNSVILVKSNVTNVANSTGVSNPASPNKNGSPSFTRYEFSGTTEVKVHGDGKWP